MIDNTTIGAVIAIMLSIAPHLLPSSDTSPEQVAKMYAEAEQHAQRIMETGDISELAALENIEKELKIPANQNALIPMMVKLQQELAESGKIQPLPAFDSPSNPAP